MPANTRLWAAGDHRGQHQSGPTPGTMGVGRLSTPSSLWIFLVKYLKVLKILKPLECVGTYPGLLQDNAGGA